MKKVIIIGAGAQANVIATVLAGEADIGEIVLTDIDPQRAREIAEVNGSPKIKAEAIDAADVDQVTARMQAGGFDLVVNATLPRFVRPVLMASFMAGINYLDMASNEIYPRPEAPIEQLEYAEQWQAAGLKCLTGAGGDPGLTNIMAKEAVDLLDRVDRIMIKDYGVVECDTPVALWSMETYLEDCSLPTTIWEDGQPRQVPPFSGAELYDFPDPLGLRGKLYYHDHEECVTIPLFCGKPVNYCDFKIGEPDIDTWKFLIQGLGLMDTAPMEIDGARVSARDVFFRKIPPTLPPKKQMELYDNGRLSSRLMLVCDVTGTREGSPRAIKLWTDSPDGKKACAWIKGANDVSWMTSIPASIFALMLLRNQIEHSGVFPPEVFTAAERAIFFAGIKQWGIDVKQSVTTVK